MIAIKNGRIVLEDSILEGKVLLIEGDRIWGFSDEVPKAERVIDAHGRYVPYPAAFLASAWISSSDISDPEKNVNTAFPSPFMETSWLSPPPNVAR